MTTGGAFIQLKGGKVRIGGSEPLEVDTDGHHWGGPATMSGQLPTFSEGDLGRTPRLVRASDGKPVEGAKLTVRQTDDSDLSGKTDTSGTAVKNISSRFQRLRSRFFLSRL